ncbi:hypothetical protein CLOL250_02330 [Clostridium sp. L2-50]|nr:hypothetical protein CLOL250_02330 [Clostridium sp. L2-50]
MVLSYDMVVLYYILFWWLEELKINSRKKCETQAFSQHFPAILFIIQYGDLPERSVYII